MQVITIPAVDGVYTSKADLNAKGIVPGHQLTIGFDGTVTAGTLTIKAKGPGGTVFETIPDGLQDLTAPLSILFTFVATEYELTLAGFTGTSTKITVTDAQVEL